MADSLRYNASQKANDHRPLSNVARPMPELLAPAGGMAEFNAALAAGADAIYCGFENTFNARRGAQSFTSNNFKDACDRAHVAGVRVYVTVNVVIRDDEMPSVLALVRRAWLLGADAFIIQDWGLLAEVRRRWPGIECHVSTQANVHDARATMWCRELGAKRVTLSRELSLSEIKQIAQTGVELECFCHGAICVCYSGVCQMSSCGGDRSANRGTCAQPCRLPYELVDEHGSVLLAPGRGRPLCPKDYYSFERLDELVATGVLSLKVEGRLKGPDYLASVILSYREQLDDLARGEVPDDETLQARKTRLKRVFNRDFTDAYLSGLSGDELMSYERSNNRGELVGEVVASRSLGSTKVRRGGNGGGRERLRTLHVAQTSICLNKPVGEGDLLEIRPLDDPNQFLTTYVPQDAVPGQTIVCRTKRAMEKGSLVRVIRSKQAMDRGAKTASMDIPRKRAVRVRILARKGRPFEVELSTVDGVARATATGFVVESARTRAVSKKDLVEHVGRMGTSPFEPVLFEVELDDGCGMGFSAVHRVRTAACEALELELLAPYARRELPPAPSREAICKDLRASVASPARPDKARTKRIVKSAVCGGCAPCSNSPHPCGTARGVHPHPHDGFDDSFVAGDKAPAQKETPNPPRGEDVLRAQTVPIPASAGLRAEPTFALASCSVPPQGQDEAQICAMVLSPAAARAARRAGAARVYATASALGEGKWPGWVIPSLDEVCRELDHGRLDPWVKGGEPVAVGNVSELVLARERGAHAEVRGCIPVHNPSCLKALEAAGAQGIWLSPELSLKEIEGLAAYASVPLGLVVYGHTRAMTCEHCVLQAADACCEDCGRCGLRKRKTYLRTSEGKLYPVQTDTEGRSRVYASWLLNATPLIPRLAGAGLRRFAVDCTLLEANEAEEAVRRAVRVLRRWQDGLEESRPREGGFEFALRSGSPTGLSQPREGGCEFGHLFSPVL